MNDADCAVGGQVLRRSSTAVDVSVWGVKIHDGYGIADVPELGAVWEILARHGDRSLSETHCRWSCLKKYQGSVGCRKLRFSAMARSPSEAKRGFVSG